jgi:hypothetical protein
MISLICFLLGIFLAIQLVAALYGLVDLGYDRARYFPRIVGRILFSISLIAVISLLLSGAHRHGFFIGIGFFLAFHICIYWIGKLIIHRISQTSGENSSD